MPNFKVLIVDDDEDHRPTLADALRERGYETICCASGDEALRVLDLEDVRDLLEDLGDFGVVQAARALRRGAS